MQTREKLAIFDNTDDLEKLKSTTNCIVKLYMGPYEAHGIIRHRTQRLRGLQDCLAENGYNVELIPTAYLDRFTLEFYGREIFRCNIKSFQFNLPCEEDAMCIRIMDVLKEHEHRFCTDINVPTYVNVTHGMRFIQQVKQMTTDDLLFEPDIRLLYEIKDNISQTTTTANYEPSEEKPESPLTMALSCYEHNETFIKPTSVSESIFHARTDSQTMESETERFRSLDTISVKTNATVKSSHVDAFDEDTGKPATDVWSRAKERGNLRRIGHMIKSEQIKSLDMEEQHRHDLISHYLLQLNKKTQHRKSSVISPYSNTEIKKSVTITVTDDIENVQV